MTTNRYDVLQVGERVLKGTSISKRVNGSSLSLPNYLKAFNLPYFVQSFVHSRSPAPWPLRTLYPLNLSLNPFEQILESLKLGG